MVWYGMVWYGMVWYGMVCLHPHSIKTLDDFKELYETDFVHYVDQACIVLYCIVLYCIVLYCTPIDWKERGLGTIV